MANAFNLTAQLNLKGPSNIGNIVSDIKKQLGTINANVNVAISANAGKNVAQLNTSLQALNKTFQSTQVSATSAATAIASFNAAVGNINIKSYQSGVNSAVTATQQLTQSQSSISKSLRASSSEMEEFGKQAGLAVRRFSAFSAVTSVIFGMTNAFSKGISAFIDFDKELVKLQQVTGESASGLQSLQDTITSLSTKLGVSSSELLSVSSTLAQAGLSARDTEKALKALALSSLAPSFDNMNETVEGSIALMRQFGIGAGDLTKALGSVNAVAAKFAVEASDIISAIQRTGGVFASASKGVSEGTQALNEFIAVFTSVRATTRESAETIATGLRTIFTRVQREGTIDALKEYGVNLTDLDGKFVGAYRAVELLSKGLNSIDPRDLKFSKIVEELGGFRQIGKVIPLIQEFGTAQQALSVAQSGQNSLTADAAKAQISLANQLSKVREEFLALFREIGSSDTFQTLVRGSLQLVSSLIKVGDAVKGILPVLAVIGISKGLDAITKFGSGFVQGVRKGPDNKAGGFSEGGVVRRFATGGVVPGSGDGDTVPAMLTPGEFVIRKQAAKSIGTDNLHRMNQYASGGLVSDAADKSKGGKPLLKKIYDTTQEYDTYEEPKIQRLKLKKGYQEYYDEGLGIWSKAHDIYQKELKSKEYKPSVNKKGKTTSEPPPLANAYIRSATSKNQAEDSTVQSLGFKELQGTKKEGYAPVRALNKIRGALAERDTEKLFKKPITRLANRDGADYYSAGSNRFGDQDIPADTYIEVKNQKSEVKNNTLIAKALLGFASIKKTKFIDNNKKDNIKSLNIAAVEVEQKNLGGVIQRLAAGGIAQRKVGYIDYDVIANETNKDIVEKGMEATGQKGPRLYTDYLTQLAVGARKDNSLQKLRAIYGVAGSGKTTLARGQGTDNGTLRKTERFPVLSPEDIQKATEILILTSSVSQTKIDDFFGDVDRAYTLSSTTDAEKQGVRSRKESRDVTGIGLENRKPGTTMGVSTDSAVGEALLSDKLGTKSAVLGRSDSGRLRRKKGNELVEVIKKKIGFTWGGFSPMTAGHESIMDSAAAMGIPPEDFIYLVGANEGITDDKASSFRTAIFDQDTRVLLAKAGAGAKGATVLPKPRDFEVPQAFDISPESGRRKVLIPGKGSTAFVADKTAKDLEKYTSAGYNTVNLERYGGISGTMVRDLIAEGNLGELQKILSPGVYDLISNNIGRIQNRAKILPTIVADVHKSQTVKLKDVESEIKAIGISRIDQKKMDDPEYAAKAEILLDLREKKKKIQAAGSFEPYKLLDALAQKDPQNYALDFSSPVTMANVPDMRVMGQSSQAPETPMPVGRVAQLAQEKNKSIQDIILEQLGGLGGPAGVKKILGIGSGDRTLSSLLQAGNIKGGKGLDEAANYVNRALAARGIRDAAEAKRLEEYQAKALHFGIAGLLPMDYSKEFEWNVGGTDIYATARGFGSTYLEEAKQMQNESSALAQKFAENIQHKNIFGGGERLAFDFDKTLVDNADILDAKGNPDISQYSNREAVEQALKNARPTRLAAKLKSLIEQDPPFIQKTRILTARPQSTADLLAQSLQSFGLPYSETDITGVSGLGTNIATLKAANLQQEEKLIDDNLDNIMAVRKAGKKGFQYTEPKSTTSELDEKMGQGNIEGAIVEKALAVLGAPIRPDAKQNRAIDYPNGLGSAAQFFPGIDPGIPTEVKRTIDGTSLEKVREEIGRHITGDAEVVKLARGGAVQNFMAGGAATKTKKPKEAFGTGETEFPTRITKKYAEEKKTADESKKAKLAWDRYPKDERIMTDDEKVKQSFQQPFDRERFASSFKEKISRDSLFERMSDFAKFVGLPQEDLTTALPLQLDFGASKRGGGLGMLASAQFERGVTGIRPYEGYDISKFGYGEKQKQEAYGLEKLITAKEKEIAKIVKTPTRTYDDGSFSFDSEAYSKANNELAEFKNRSLKLKDLKRDAEKAALSEQTAISSATGRGTISFAPSMGYSSDTKNSTLYHEMTHQLFEGLRKKSAGSFNKYRDRVSSLFSGDNDDLADAFDSLTAGGGYTSADVVYGRSYKSNNLSQILSSYYRQNLDFSRDTATIPQDTTKNLASLSNQSTAAKRAREYRPINPKVNEALLQAGDKFGITQEKINRMEDNGKEEFLTTLMENAPKLDGKLPSILDSTLTELLSGAGIQRQKFAVGGKASRGVDLDKEFIKNPITSPFNDKAISKRLGSEVYDLEKGSGLSSFEFDDAKKFADTAGYNMEDFKKLLARRVEAKNQRSQIKTDPSDILKQLMPQNRTSTPKQLALAETLKGEPDAGYRPIMTGVQRIAQARSDISNATRYAVGGVAQLTPPSLPSPPKKPDPNAKVKAIYQDKEMDAIRKKWPIGTKIESGEWKLPGHKSIGVGQFAGDHKELTDFGGSGWKMRLDPKTDNDNILIADWFGKNKSLFSGYKIATNTDHPVWSAYVSKGTGPEIQKAAKKAQSDLGKFITLNQAYDTTDTMIPGTGISGRFEIRGDERSGTPRANEIVDTINERRKATTKYRNFYLQYKNTPGFQKGFPSSTSGQGGVPGTHYFQWLMQTKKDAARNKSLERAKELQAAQDEEIKLIESVLKEKTPEYSFGSQQSSGPKTRLAPPPPPLPPKKLAGGGPVSLYHGSNTGVNDNVLKSFKEKGALSDVAQGYGQGAGFYVYSGREKAKEQAMMRVKGGLGSFTVVSGDTAGKPMVLTFKEMLEPETWDLDYELNKGPVVKWLAENYDKIKDKVAPGEKLTGIKDVVSPDSSKGIMSHGIRVQSDTGSRKTIYSGTDSDLREGQLVGQIMSRLQAHDPKMVGDFENTFFKSPSLSSGDWDNLALKYVGSSPLKPTNIETFANGGLVPGVGNQDTVPATLNVGDFVIKKSSVNSIGIDKLASMGRYAAGGSVDKVPALLTPGEFVFNKGAAQKIGYGKLNSMNKYAKFASGGAVGMRVGYADGGIVEKLTGFVDMMKSIMEEDRSGKGNLPVRPENIDQSSIAIPKESVGDLEALIQALDQLGIKSSASADLIKAGAEISYEAAEKALEADIHKLKIAGASSAEIIKAEAALNTVRKNGEQQVKSRTVLENAFTTSKSGQKIDSGRTQQNILVLAKREEEQRTASARAAKGSDLTDKEIAGIKSKSFMSATSKITGVSTKGLKQSGVTGEGIEKYIAQSMLDVKTLGEMDKQYTIIRKQQLLAAKIGADEATKIIKQELASRRATLDQVAKSKNMPSLIEKNSGEKLTDFLGSKKGTLLNMGIAAAPGIAKGIMGPATTSSGAGMYAGAQGAASTIGAGLQLASKSGPLAPFVLAGTAVAAFATAVKDSRNAFLEFEKNLRTQNIDKALESASSALESFSRDTEDVFAKADVSRYLTTAGTEAASLTKTEQTIPKAFWFNLLDMKSGNKEATDRSKIMDKFDKDKYIPTAYLSSLSMFGGDEQRRAYTASMIPEEAQSNAKKYAEIGSASRQFIEKRSSGGESLADIKASPEFEQLAKNIALSNASVQEQILEIDNSTAYRTQADREAAKEAIIRAHADREVSKITLSAERAKAASELEKTSRSFSMSFKRMFENMDAVISRTNTELSQFNSSLDASIAGMSGQSKNNKTDFESVNILKNPKAYSTDQVNKANAQAGTLFGSDSQIVSGLAGVGEKLETSLLKSINATIKNNPTASDTKIAIDVENAIGKEIGGLGLPKDLAGQLGKEITNAVGDLRKDGTKKIDLDQLMDKIPGLKNAIDSAKNAQNASVEALQNWQNTLNQYSDAMNKAAEMELEAAERRRRANDIVVEASMNLGRALGKDYGADSGTQIRNQKVAEMTGGLTSPTDIKNQMTDLEAKRQRQQGEVDLSKQQSVGGGKNSIQAVVANEKALKQTNNQLRQTGAALKLLAESGEAASTALNAVQEAQRKQQGKVGLIEKLVTSGPEELANFNKSLNSLQKMSAGQTVNQTVDERKNTLSVLNDITPLLGSGKEANNLKATALESMLKDSGIGVSAQFQDILTALRNPESDTETQQAIKVYQEAISVQSEANKTLASINQSLADDIAQKTADAISTALQGLTVKFDDKQLADIAKGVRDVATTTAGGKAVGGLIYAAGGSLIDFQPKGTDTVPAMLTAGEFVVNKSATSKNMGLLHDINSGKANYYATGGYVSNIAKPDFRKSGTKATEQEYPELGSGLGKKTFSAYGGLQSLPMYSSKVSMPLSSFTEKEGSGTYVAGSPQPFEAPTSYTLGTGQPSRIKSLLTRGRDTAHLYGSAETTAPILKQLSLDYLDPETTSASNINTKQARIEGEDNFETYKTKLNEVKGMLPSSMEFKDKEYANVDGYSIHFPSQSNVVKWSTRVNPSVQVTKGGDYAELRLNNLAHNIDQDKFRVGPFLGPLPSRPAPDLTDYAIGDYLWTSIVAGPAQQVSAGRLSVEKTLGFKPLKLATDDTTPNDYMSKLYQITRKINEASKSITGGDTANFETDNDKKVGLFNEQLDQIYKGTVTHRPFTGDFLDLKKFTNDDSIQVYSTSVDQWKSTYLKNLQEQIRNNDKFKDLDYYGKGSKEAVTIEPEGGVAKPFPWIGGDTDFEFSDVVKKIMQNEVDANKNKAETLLKSHVVPSKKLPPVTKAKLELPYDISYDERKSPGSTTDSIFMVRSPQSDLAVFKNLGSNLYVDQAGYSASLPQPMDQVHAQIAGYEKLNEYLIELGTSGEESTKSKVLHDEIFRKQIDIKGKFLTSDLNSFDPPTGGERTISVPIGDYLISAIKKTKNDKAQARKDNSKVKFKPDEANDEFFSKKQYPGAALAFILGAQELFSSGHQYEVPQLLGKGWFAPRLDNQYKSIYDVDYATLRNYMGRLGSVFNDKAAIINKFLPRAPNPQIADLLTQTAINIHGAYKAFSAMSEGKTGSISGLFAKTDFDTATPQGDPALTTKAMEVFQSLGMGQKIDAAGSTALTEDEQKERARDLKGVKLNQLRSKDATTKELGPDNLPKTYLDLFDIAINPYNRFPRRDARRDLLTEFIDSVPNARNPGSNLPLFTQTTGPLFQTALSKLKEWYDGQGTWAGVDYLFEDGVIDPASKEPKSYDTRIQELEANQVATIYDDAKKAYAHIGGKPKFGELPSLEYYKTVDAPQYKQVGGMIYASTGKLINFEPRGTDTVPAMLTPGEFVINRQATQQHLPLLQAINNGGDIKGLNKGGMVYLEQGSEKPVRSSSIMETITPYVQGAGNKADSIVRAADTALLTKGIGLGSVAAAVGLGGNANAMLAADVGDIGISTGQGVYKAASGAKLVGGLKGGVAGYGAYVGASYLTNTIGLATGAKDISEYDKANRTQANQGYFKNVGENLYDPGKAGIQMARETYGLIADQHQLAMSYAKQGQPKKNDPARDDYIKSLQMQANADKFANGGLVYLAGGGSVNPEYATMRKTQRENTKQLVEAKRAQIKQHSKDVKAQQLTVKNQIRASLGKTPLAAQSEATTDNGVDYDPNQNGNISPQEREAGDLKRGILSLSEDDRKILRIDNPDKREAALQRKMDPVLFALRTQAIKSREDRRATFLESKIKEHGAESLSDQDSVFLATRKKKIKAEDTTNKTTAFATKVGQSLKSAPSAVAAAKTYLAGAMATNPGTTQSTPSSGRPTVATTPTAPTTTPAAATTPTKPTVASPTTPPTPAKPTAAPTTPTTPNSPYPSLTDKEFDRNTALAKAKRAQREQKRENELADANVEIDDNVSKMLKAGVSTKQIIEMNASKKIRDQADVVGGLRNQVAALKSRETSGFFGIGGTNNSAKIKELEKQIAVENLKLEAVKEGPREMTAQEAVVTAKNRAEIDKVKANSKDTRTFSEKHLGLNLQAGYQTAGETTDRLVASAEIGMNDIMDAVGSPANDRMRPSAKRIAENRIIAKDKDTRPFSEKYLGLNFKAGIQTAKEQVSALGSVGSVLNQSIEQSLGIKPKDRLGRSLSKKAIAARKKDSDTFNKGIENVQNVPGLKTAAKVGMGALEVAGAAGESGVGVIRAGVGTTVAIGAGLTAGVAESVGANTVARYADAFSEQGVIEAERGVRNIQNAGATIGQNVIDSSLGTNIYGEARKEAAGRIGEIAQNRSDAAADVAGNAGRYLQTGADFVTEAAGSAATDIGMGKLATAAQSRVAAAVANIDVGKLATTGTKAVTKGAGKVRKYVGDAVAAPGKRAAARVREISGPSQRKVDKLIAQGYSPGDAAELVTDHRSYALDEIQYRNLRRKVGGKPFGRETATPERAASIAKNKAEKAAEEKMEANAVAARRASKPRVTAQEFMDRQAQTTGERIGSREATAQANREAGLARQKVLKESGGTKIWRQENRAIDRGVSPRHVNNAFVIDSKTKVSAQQQEQISDLMSTGRHSQATAMADSSVGPFETVRTAQLKKGTGSFDYLREVEQRRAATPTSKVMDVMDNNPVTYAQVKEATSAKAAKEAIDSGRVKAPEVPKTPAAPIKAGVGTSSDIIEKVAARKQALAENLGAYASSPEAAEALKKSGVFDIRSVEVRDSLQARNVGGDSNLRAAGASFSPSTDTMKLTTNRVNSEALDASIDHELGHSMQKKTIGGLSSADGKTGPLVYEEKLRASLGPDIDKFLSDKKGGYQALRKAASKEANVGNLYTADRIEAEPVELFTSLIQASHSSGFAKNKEAVEMLKKLMKFHGYAKGGIVYASNGALIEAQQGTDRVPAMLTPGEFVVNSQSAQRHMPVLNAINSGHYANGGVVQYLSGGGAVQPAYLANAGMVNNIANSSSQSGVLNSASAAKSVAMEKPSWVDDFISKFNQGASTLVQSASEIASGASNIVSGAQKLSEVSLPDSIALNGNFGFTKEAISNIIGRSVGESVSVSASNSANQIASSEANTKSNIAKSTDYGIT